MIISKALFLSKVLEDTLWQNKGVIKEREVQRMQEIEAPTRKGAGSSLVVQWLGFSAVAQVQSLVRKQISQAARCGQIKKKKKKKKTMKVPGQQLCNRPKVKLSLCYNRQLQKMSIQEKKKLRVTVLSDHVENRQRRLLYSFQKIWEEEMKVHRKLGKLKKKKEGNY